MPSSKSSSSKKKSSRSSSSSRRNDESRRHEPRRNDESPSSTSSDSEGETVWRNELFDMMIGVQRKLSDLDQRVASTNSDLTAKFNEVSSALEDAAKEQTLTPRVKQPRRSRAFAASSSPGDGEGGDEGGSPTEVQTQFGRWTR